MEAYLSMVSEENKNLDQLDESKKLLDRYQELRSNGKKDSAIIDIMMSDSSFKRFSRDQMSKIIGDALRSGKISKKVKEDVELEEKKKLDPVNDKENDKEFKDREDKDIDNDGDVDSSDEFLHKKRAATDDAIDGGKKPAKKEAVEPEPEEDEVAEPKKKPKTGKASLTKDIKHNSHTADATAEISKIESVDTRAAFIEMWSHIEEAVKSKQVPDSASKPEGIMDKESPKSKEFAKKHDVEMGKKPELVADDEEGHDMATKAGRATKQSSGRGSDNLSNGDKSPVKGK